MCLNNSRPVILHYSEKRLIDEHDHFMDKASYKRYYEQTRPFKVRKNSKFNTLRKTLPQEFEWIKTRKRLCEESMYMSHCVWSYYGKIGANKCAIYSYYDEEGKFDITGKGERERYTIEFCKRKTGYYITQIQTRFDRGGGAKLEEYLNELLNDNRLAV